ncbi:hypothetical protein AWW67_16555 [Roseivirga seohaensis]|uniref:Lipoprotein n=2 Tax=Roseivirga seohaensis TaxID=1914963 RepID=A0A0L8AI60_9BACT|nr:hypothetical protein [Roseivirga seohaensis]KOF01840.1 hypothetical protein OB69_16025 [Roseivirga seohaensis subsp. aquiponti]KYG85319.1 hypothetical protein AWW67_16555 [Roseivirga seohaensis]
MMKANQYKLLSYNLFVVLFFLASCKSAEKKNTPEFTVKNAREFSLNTEGVKEVAPSNMIKDAIRLKGEIESVKSTSDRGNTYVFKVEEIVKYGATFATVAPAVGEKISLETPADVQFSKGDKVLIDVLTPITKTKEMLSATMVQN